MLSFKLACPSIPPSKAASSETWAGSPKGEQPSRIMKAYYVPGLFIHDLCLRRQHRSHPVYSFSLASASAVNSWQNHWTTLTLRLFISRGLASHPVPLLFFLLL